MERDKRLYQLEVWVAETEVLSGARFQAHRTVKYSKPFQTLAENREQAREIAREKYPTCYSITSCFPVWGVEAPEDCYRVTHGEQSACVCGTHD